jgi:hypothetical protein
MMALCLFIWGGSSTTVYAADGRRVPELVNSVNNANVSHSNAMINNIKQFTPQDVTEIEKYSDISVAMLDEDNAKITITNKTPEKINYYADGATEKYFTKNVYFGTVKPSHDISMTKSSMPGLRLLSTHTPYPKTVTTSPSDIFVQVRITANCSEYDVGTAYLPQYRLISGSAALLSCVENGYRNLIVKPRVFGGYENPDGTRGSSGYLSYPRTIASPVIGTAYSISTNNSNYYTSGGVGLVEVDVSVEWRHGTTWGNYSTFVNEVCGL